MKKVILTVIATCLVLIGGVDGGRTLTDLEIRRQLKQLNKPAVKSCKVVILVSTFVFFVSQAKSPISNLNEFWVVD